MFGGLIRVAMVLVAGSLLAITLGMIGGQMVETQNDIAGEETDNQQWASVVITWFPGIVIATICIILIGGAIARRSRVV